MKNYLSISFGNDDYHLDISKIICVSIKKDSKPMIATIRYSFIEGDSMSFPIYDIEVFNKLMNSWNKRMVNGNQRITRGGEGNIQASGENRSTGY